MKIEAKFSEVQFRYERVNDANRVVLTDEVVQTLWQRRHLLSVLAFHESRQMSSAARYVHQFYGSVRRGVRGFSHRLGREREYKVAPGS